MYIYDLLLYLCVCGMIRKEFMYGTLCLHLLAVLHCDRRIHLKSEGFFPPSVFKF